ncbi:MAG: hypothetical protein GY847_36860 [Proteobacteria bacterium]|nr:hypothetical protein [Pseudomonadota bacterium]
MALANRQDEIRDANGEILGLFYYDVVNKQVLGASETSEMMDQFGWRGGWRIEDRNELDLLSAQGKGGGQESLLFVRYPIMFVLETATMRIVAGEKDFKYDDSKTEIDPIAEVEKINSK